MHIYIYIYIYIYIPTAATHDVYLIIQKKVLETRTLLDAEVQKLEEAKNEIQTAKLEAQEERHQVQRLRQQVHAGVCVCVCVQGYSV